MVEQIKDNMYTMNMRNPKIEFIGWDKSALELVGEKLLKLAQDEPENFRQAMVVVPTAESGRSLREWLAQEAARQLRKPLLMPCIKLAGELIEPKGIDVATELDTTAAWVKVLTEGEPHKKWPELFRCEIPEIHRQSWALKTAERLMRLRLQMEQYEVTIDALLDRLHKRAGVATELRGRWDMVETEEMSRWRELKELYALVDAKLASWDKEPAWIARARALESCAQENREGAVIVACLPELSPQVQTYLRGLESALPGRVRIWINAPNEPEWCAKAFDMEKCGRLNMEYWAQRVYAPDELSDEQIIVAPSAKRMAQEAVLAVGDAPQEEVVLASCDPSFSPVLVSEFGKQGWRVHVPEGRSVDTTDLAALPGVLASASETPEYVSAVEPLLRNMAAQRLWSGKGFSAFKFGKLLDMIHQRYYPANTSYLLQLLDPDRPLPVLHQSSGMLPGTPEDNPPNPQMPNELDLDRFTPLRSRAIYEYAKRVLKLVEDCKADIRVGMREIQSVLAQEYKGTPLQGAALNMAMRVRQVAEFAEVHRMAPSEAWALLDHMLGLHPEPLKETLREKTQIDAYGWRELAYVKGSRIILTGFHEGCVPEALPLDPFLPDSLRQMLGMPCVRWREARDGFLLAGLLHRRETGAEVKVLLSRLSADGMGTLLAPSSLLYHCQDDDLAKRVKDKLFAEMPPEELEMYGKWTLSAPDAETCAYGMESVKQIAPDWVNKYADPERCFSPSQIKEFLTCPLRFWMKHAMGISHWDAYRWDHKVEMEAAEYGTLVHNVLEDVARRYPRWAAVDGEDAVLAFAGERLDARTSERFGKRRMPATLKRQMNRIRKSLKRFVEWHCKELKEGWECYDCEHEVTKWPMQLNDGGSAFVSMRADRIDWKPNENLWRIIDYKTHNCKPEEKHLKNVPAKMRGEFEQMMGEELFPLVNGSQRWADVQLPMYAEWLKQEKNCNLPELMYINLPSAGKEGEVCNPFSEYDELLHESALTWAASAIRLMREGLCLYSAESLGIRVASSDEQSAEDGDPRLLFSPDNLRII